MARHDDLHEDGQRDVIEELSGLAYRAGFGAALIAAERPRRSAADEAGNRIVRAAQRLQAPNSVVSPGGWSDSEGELIPAEQDDAFDDESGDEYEGGRW